MTQRSTFRYFKTSPEIIRLTVMMNIRVPLSLPNVEILLHEWGIDFRHESVLEGRRTSLGVANNFNGLRVEKVRRQSRFIRQCPIVNGLIWSG